MKKNNQSEKKNISQVSDTDVSVMENPHRSPVTVIGLGPMGQALAGAFLMNGHPTTLWNRTAEKADYLISQGRPFQIQSPARSLQAPSDHLCSGL